MDRASLLQGFSNSTCYIQLIIAEKTHFLHNTSFFIKIEFWARNAAFSDHWIIPLRKWRTYWRTNFWPKKGGPLNCDLNDDLSNCTSGCTNHMHWHTVHTNTITQRSVKTQLIAHLHIVVAMGWMQLLKILHACVYKYQLTKICKKFISMESWISSIIIYNEQFCKMLVTLTLTLTLRHVIHTCPESNPALTDV